jgi:hypothetical protein
MEETVPFDAPENQAIKTEIEAMFEQMRVLRQQMAREQKRIEDLKHQTRLTNASTRKLLEQMSSR